MEIQKLSRYILKEAGRVKKRFKKTGLHANLVKSINKIKGLEEELFGKAEKVPFLWEALMACTIKLKEYLKEERDELEEERFVSDLDAITKTYKQVVEVAEKFRPILAEAIETVENFERAPGREAAV
jgi:Sec-independent protein translocase protein TatA